MLKFIGLKNTSYLNNKRAQYLKERLDLSELLGEGGYYKETYRSDKTILLPCQTDGERSISTSIYYLLDGAQFSAFHRLKSDEIWHFYIGSSVTLYIINKMENLSEVNLGSNIEQGDRKKLIEMYPQHRSIIEKLTRCADN